MRNIFDILTTHPLATYGFSVAVPSTSVTTVFIMSIYCMLDNLHIESYLIALQLKK